MSYMYSLKGLQNRVGKYQRDIKTKRSMTILKQHGKIKNTKNKPKDKQRGSLLFMQI